MEDWIAGTFAVLGTLLVVAGGTLIVLKTIGRLGGTPPDGATVPVEGVPAAPVTEPDSPPAAGGRRPALRRLSPATQLIAWGILLLVVSAFAVGLISFGISLEAGTGQATG